MAKITAAAPKGMRDFNPEEMVRRNYIFDTIKQIYAKYGFKPIETPAMEKLETLTGKYGDEGDRLIFKVLNSGDYLKTLKENHTTTESLDAGKSLRLISEKALRYDLTVPFARYVVQYYSKLQFPFKRYQIQPVWRADNPQKGRYREFYQCDADVIGSDALFNEIEFVQIFHDVLQALRIEGFRILLNNRKILSGIAEVTGIGDQLISFTVALDKLDKIGEEKVLEEMRSKGIPDEKLKKIAPFLQFSGNNAQKITFLEEFLASSETGQKGVEELRKVIDISEKSGIHGETLAIDITLARGLDYYTGCIFEVKVPGSGFGSIAGGGRYDNLTGIFGLDGISGCGISFGADRIYDLLLQENLFPAFDAHTTRYLFLNFGEAEAEYSFSIVQQLRRKGINAALYPDTVKIKKQFSYADATKAENVVLIGSEEMKNKQLTVKNMQSGNQETFDVSTFLKGL